MSKKLEDIEILKIVPQSIKDEFNKIREFKTTYYQFKKIWDKYIETRSPTNNK